MAFCIDKLERHVATVRKHHRPSGGVFAVNRSYVFDHGTDSMFELVVQVKA